MQGTNLYLIVFVVMMMLLPEDDKDVPVGLYIIGIVVMVTLFIGISGAGTIWLEYLER